MGRFGSSGFAFVTFAKVRNTKYRSKCPCCKEMFTHNMNSRIYCDKCDKSHRQLLKGGSCSDVESSKVVRSSGK